MTSTMRTNETIRRAARTKEENKVELKPRVAFQDLCSTCAAAPTCIHRTTGKPVYSCDDYENHPTVAAPVPSTARTDIKPVTLKGLCVDCKHRESCILAKTQGGVWHCEEYE